MTRAKHNRNGNAYLNQKADPWNQKMANGVHQQVRRVLDILARVRSWCTPCTPEEEAKCTQ